MTHLPQRHRKRQITEQGSGTINELFGFQKEETVPKDTAQQLVIGVGSQKAGTSSISLFLRMAGMHFPSKSKKELHAFRIRSLIPSRIPHPLDRKQYLSLWEAKGPSEVFGEFTPDYIDHPTAMWNLSQIVPEAKIVISVRNPVDRAFSAYTHGVGAGRIDKSLSFEQVVDLAIRGTATGHWIPGLLTKGLYAKGVQRVLNLYPQKQVFIANYDWWTLPQNLEAFQHKLLEFCGVPINPIEKIPHVNKSRHWQNAREVQSRKPQPETKEKLQVFFQDSKEELELLLDENLGWW